MKNMKRLLLASALTLVISQSIFANEEVVPEQSRFESLSKLTKVIGTVEKYYVDDIKLQEKDSTTVRNAYTLLGIDISAEHGAMIKENGTWKEQINDVIFWKKEVLLSLNEITSKCPGSFIEEKSFSLAWHYRNSETEAGHTYSRELIRLLDNNIHFSVLKILDGNKVVELLHNGIGKGISVNNLIAQNTYDCILSIGDDVTDEDMFEVLKDNENSFTIKVGSGNISAKYRLDAPKNVLQLLELL